MEYRLTGAQDPSSRIDRVRVEGPSEDFPEGKVLTLGGAPAELSNEQVATLSNYVRLEAVKGATAASATVDQPGVPATSHSTDVPPDPGRVPEVHTLSKDELVGELGRVRHQDPAALPELSERSNKDDLQKGLANYYGQEV
jgi:hypothetical protein